MNVIFTCGGTGGHINPAIAVANVWKERHPNDQILFIGAKDRMEEDLVPKAGFDLKLIRSTGIMRSWSLEDILYNIRSVGHTVGGLFKCMKIIRDFKTDVVIGTGGYASFTTLLAAKLCGVPTCVHEANALPGLANKLAGNFVDRVLICFPESAAHYRNADRCKVVGMPVRQEFLFMKREAAREEMGIGEKPLVVSAFGSQGAEAMNVAIADMLELEKQAGYPFHHIHAAGSYGWDWMQEKVKGLELDQKDSPVDVREFIYNMPTVMAAADVVISRAGSSTCNEIAATGTPCVLIPSPNVTDNHQEKNARALEAQEGAAVLLEHECTGARLWQEVNAILADPKRQTEMRKALLRMAVPDSAQRICDEMERLAAKE